MKYTWHSLFLGLICLTCGQASAQTDEDLIPTDRKFVSPEQFVVEFRAGSYTPEAAGFGEVFDDVGPLLELELDYLPLLIKDVLDAGVGAAFGMSKYRGGAINVATNSITDEETTLSILPLTVLLIARVDVLPRKFSIPFLLTGKLGYSWARWSTATGDQTDAIGWSHGVRWAGQLGLDLDTFEPRAARALDEEWGINHSYAFIEAWGFAPVGESLEIGDTSWVAGLGFNF